MINKVLYIGMTVISLVLLNLVPVMAALESEYFVPTLVGSSARMIRLGNIEGFSHEASSIFENPAGLYRVNRMSSSAFTTTFMEEVTYQNVAMAMRMPIGVLGVGYMGLGVDEIPRTFKNEVKEFDINGYFGYKNSMAKVAYQLSQSRHLHFGGSFSYYLTEFDTVKASGYNVDLGVVVDSDVLDASIVVKNVLKSSKIRYTDATEVTDIEDYSSRGKEEVLPFQTIYSMKYSLQNFQWYGQLKTVGRERQFVKSFGVDFNPKFLRFFHLSAGYKQFPVVRLIEGTTESVINDSATLGVGLDLFGLSFDYAYEKSEHIEYENKHYFSASLSF